MRLVTFWGLSTVVEEGAALVHSLTAGEVSREDAVGFVQTAQGVDSGLNRDDLAASKRPTASPEVEPLQQDYAHATTLAQALPCHPNRGAKLLEPCR
jgi:hypothetical protein